MVAEGTLGIDGPDVPVAPGARATDSRPSSLSDQNSKNAATPTPAASPATGEQVANAPAAPARPRSNMGSGPPGTGPNNLSSPDPVDPEPPALAEAIQAPAPPETTPKAKPAEGDGLAFPTDRSIAPGKPVAEIMAKVGDNIITGRELRISPCLRPVGKSGDQPEDIPPDQPSVRSSEHACWMR